MSEYTSQRTRHVTSVGMPGARVLSETQSKARPGMRLRIKTWWYREWHSQFFRYGLCGAIIILLVLFAIASFVAYRESLAHSSSVSVTVNSSVTDGVLLSGQVSSLNYDTHLLQINWYWSGQGSYASAINVNGMASDSFLSKNASAFTGGVLTSVGSYYYAFESEYTRQTFQTTHHISPSAADTPAASSAAYPFDYYQVNASFAVLDTATNQTMPVVSCAIISTVQGWAATSFTIDAPYQGLHFAGTGCVLQLSLARDFVLRTIAVVIYLVQWMITLLVLYLALRTTLLDVPLNPSMLAFPATILFALPTLRAALPDKPGYGMLSDVVVFLLCEAIVATSLAVLVITKGLVKPTPPIQKAPQLVVQPSSPPQLHNVTMPSPLFMQRDSFHVDAKSYGDHYGDH